MRVLITRHLFPEAVEILRPLAELDYHDDHDGLSENQLCKRIRNVEAVVCQLTDTISRDVIAAGVKLGILAKRRGRLRQH